MATQVQSPIIHQKDGVSCAMLPGARRMPAPIIDPIPTAKPNTGPSTRRRLPPPCTVAGAVIRAGYVVALTPVLSGSEIGADCAR
jgi:hypothetical protein